MKIDSPRFGSLDVEGKKLIEFPAGLPGFEESKRFTLIELTSSQQAVAVLQSVDMPEVAFSVTTPDFLGLHYEFALTDSEEALLGNPRAEDVAVLLILRRDEPLEAKPAVADAPVRANLMAPLVINCASMKGFQKVIARMGCELTLRPAA